MYSRSCRILLDRTGLLPGAGALLAVCGLPAAGGLSGAALPPLVTIPRPLMHAYNGSKLLELLSW